MCESITMSKKCILLKDIKNYLKKLECGQLEIEAGQWELHKDILNMKQMFEELKTLKAELEEMKKSHIEQMGIIRKLELTLSQQPEDVCPSQKNNNKNCEVVSKNVDKRMAKSCNKDSKKKTHVVHSEEVIEITSHVESNDSRSNSDCKSEGAEEKKGKRETKKHLRSPIRSIIYFRKLNPQPSILNTRIRLPSKEKDSAMLQRYLNDSAKYCEENVSIPIVDGSKSAEVCTSNYKENEQCKSDSWNWFNNKPNNPISPGSDKCTKWNFGSINIESAMPMTAPHIKKRKMPSYLNDKSKRKKKEWPHVCGICKKGFHTKDLLRAHEVVHKKMSENSISYKCDLCNNSYKSSDTLEKHRRKCQLIRSLFRKS